VEVELVARVWLGIDRSGMGCRLAVAEVNGVVEGMGLSFRLVVIFQWEMLGLVPVCRLRWVRKEVSSQTLGEPFHWRKGFQIRGPWLSMRIIRRELTMGVRCLWMVAWCQRNLLLEISLEGN
jgi:hypothetical protein